MRRYHEKFQFGGVFRVRLDLKSQSPPWEVPVLVGEWVFWVSSYPKFLSPPWKVPVLGGVSWVSSEPKSLSHPWEIPVMGGLFWVISYPKSLSPLWEVHFLEEGVFWMSSDLKSPSPPWEVLLQKHKHTWVMDISAQFKEWNYVLYRQQNLNNCNCKNLYYIESNNKKEHCTM